MKTKIMAYSAYMVISIFLSLTLALLPALLLFMFLFENLDVFILGLGWPFPDIANWIALNFNSYFPSFMFDKFYFVTLIVPIFFFCYAIFLGFLIGFFKLSHRLMPFLEDGYYDVDDYMMIYEYSEIYYIMLPYFAWFLTVFLDTKPRHQLFGAKIGRGTVVGNGRLFNPERTIMGENCFFGYDAILSGHVYEGKRLYLRTVRLGNNVTVGANAVVLPGVDIGDNVVIGANTVVPKDKVIPANTIWVHGKAIPRKPAEKETTDEEGYTPENGEHI
ncbi:MAG: acyltransferase [Candidatus Thorarchaeota archaeon]|nr:acyltransferase [Candidatus Thorarchaeota archaeon]